MNLTPIQTEYSGVVFRSKSEAIFARGLELTGFRWEYEPDEWRTKDGWVPDFKSILMTTDHKIRLILIEYKPDDVTETCLRQTADRIREIIASGKFSCGNAYVACGSAYNRTRKAYILEIENGSYEWKRTQYMQNHFFWQIDEAAKYRFDLKQPCVQLT